MYQAFRVPAQQMSFGFMRAISPRQAMACRINRCNQRLGCLFDVGHNTGPSPWGRLALLALIARTG